MLRLIVKTNDLCADDTSQKILFSISLKFNINIFLLDNVVFALLTVCSWRSFRNFGRGCVLYLCVPQLFNILQIEGAQQGDKDEV